MRKYYQGRTYDRRFFESIDSEEKAYWLGFIFADGAIIPSKRTVSIGLAIKDKDHLVKFAHTLGLKTDDVRIYHGSSNYLESYEYCRLMLSHKLMYDSLVSHGMTNRKSKDGSIPIVELPLEAHLLRGIFDGDGSISVSYYKDTKKHRYSFSVTANRRAAVQYADVLLRHGISSVNVGKDHSHFRVRVSSRKAIQQVYKLFYRQATVYLERKYHVFKDAVIKSRNEAGNS